MQRTDDEQYTKPEIADYGDLVEKTAAGATGQHLDHKLEVGQSISEATFLSSAP